MEAVRQTTKQAQFLAFSSVAPYKKVALLTQPNSLKSSLASAQMYRYYQQGNAEHRFPEASIGSGLVFHVSIAPDYQYFELRLYKIF